MISWSRQDGIAVVTIDNPPVNASNHAIRQGLMTALAETAQQSGLSAVVLTGAGGNFIAGSDIREFGAPLAPPQLPDVIAAIEEHPLPVIAAIDGACLGGGYELTLGCDARIATARARLGLPEVGLGLVPGAGGTQRLPRLTGIPAALELILSARHVRADEALQLGMIDAIAPVDPVEAARDWLRAHPGKTPLRLRRVAPFDPAEAEAIRERALRRARHRPAAVQAADLVMRAAQAPFTEALAEERAQFQSIRMTPEASALRHVFFAERAAARAPRSTQIPQIGTVAVIGGGTMGAGIAHAMLRAGLTLRLIERDSPACKAAEARLSALREADQTRSRIPPEEAAAMASRLSLHSDMSAVAGADLVLEAVFEDLEVKRALMADIAPHLGPQTIVASNTSYLDLEKMADALPDPDRFLGLHFFSPAHVMKLLEIVQATRSAPDVLAAGFALAKRLGKQPVLARNGFGFIGNRIYAAYRRHAEYALQDGASVQQIDAAMRGFGMAMGPFEVADLSGLDIAWQMRRARGRTPGQRYVDIPDRLCEAGRFGRKTKAGYYAYADGAARPDPAAEAMIAASRAVAGIIPAPLSDEQIQTRLLGAIVTEALRVLDDGIASRASDIDVTLIHGYGFPRWTGGPLHLAATLTAQERDGMLGAVARAEGAAPDGRLLRLLQDTAA